MIGAGLVAGCSGSSTKPSATLTSLTVDGARTLTEGESVTLSATAHYADGSSQAVTSGVSWASDDVRIATVDARGVVTAISAGQSQIRATFNTVSGTTAVRVNAAPRSVSGKVHESFPTESVAIAGATVTAVGADGATVSATTDASGAFTLNLVPGVAQVTVAAAGYETATTNADVTRGTVSLALVPVLREVNESFDYVPYPGSPTPVAARTFRFAVHHAGTLHAAFTNSNELASAQADTCIDVRDSANHVLGHTNGQYDNFPRPIDLIVPPDVYTVVFTSCNVNGYSNWRPEDMTRWSGEVKHPN